MKLSDLYWYRITPLHFVLWPLSILYECFLMFKKLFYWLEILPTVKLSVPVIVVDSLSSIEDNKSPLILCLVNILLKYGYVPGIVSPSKIELPGTPRALSATSFPDNLDNKTLLIAQHCSASCPIWVGNNSADTAQALLKSHPDCDVIICTNGLIDFHLERDIEIVTVDYSEQSFGNGLLIPAGPLRMNLRHLTESSIIIASGELNRSYDYANRRHDTYNMKLITEMAYNVLNPELRRSITEFKNKNLHAVTSDDNAYWLFDFVHKSGVHAQLHDFREHHSFRPHEIVYPEADAVIMPEENALQCKKFAHEKLWAIPRTAWISDELQIALAKKLQQTNIKKSS